MNRKLLDSYFIKNLNIKKSVPKWYKEISVVSEKWGEKKFVFSELSAPLFCDETYIFEYKKQDTNVSNGKPRVSKTKLILGWTSGFCFLNMCLLTHHFRSFRK
jgi:hypothetical protein